MEFYARHVSAGGEGDYYQAAFDAQESGDGSSSYLIIQRDFEDAVDRLCYIETHDECFRGHYRIQRIDFSPTQLRIVLDRGHERILCVRYSLLKDEYERVARIVHVISGETDPY